MGRSEVRPQLRDLGAAPPGTDPLAPQFLLFLLCKMDKNLRGLLQGLNRRLSFVCSLPGTEGNTRRNLVQRPLIQCPWAQVTRFCCLRWIFPACSQSWGLLPSPYPTWALLCFLNCSQLSFLSIVDSICVHRSHGHQSHQSPSLTSPKPGGLRVQLGASPLLPFVAAEGERIFRLLGQATLSLCIISF